MKINKSVHRIFNEKITFSNFLGNLPIFLTSCTPKHFFSLQCCFCVTGIIAWCLNVDVKIVPAVQEERQRNKEKGEGEVESTSPANADMPVEKILEAELAVEPQTDTYIDAQVINSFMANFGNVS